MLSKLATFPLFIESTEDLVRIAKNNNYIKQTIVTTSINNSDGKD